MNSVWAFQRRNRKTSLRNYFWVENFDPASAGNPGDSITKAERGYLVFVPNIAGSDP